MSTETLPVIDLDSAGNGGTVTNPVPSAIRASGGIAVAAVAAPAPVETAPAYAPEPAPEPQLDTSGRVVSRPGPAQGGGGGVASAPGGDDSGSLANAVSKALAQLDRPASSESRKAKSGAPEAQPAANSAPISPIEDGDPTAGIGLEEPAVDTTNWTPQAARAFERVKGQRAALKAELDQVQAQAAAYEAQINELKGALVGEGTIEELQARVREFEQQRMFTDLEGTLAYQEAIQKPLQLCVDALDSIAERAGVKGEVLFEIITSEPDPENPPEYDANGLPFMSKDQKIEMLLAKATPRDRAAVFATLNQVEVLMDKRNQMFQNVEQAFREAQELEQVRQQQSAAEAAKYRRQVTEAVVGRLAERIPFLQDMPGLDLGKLKEEIAAVDYKTLHPVDAQYQAAASKLFPAVVNDLFRAQAEVESLLSRLAEYEQAEPGAGVSITSANPGASVRGAVPVPGLPPGATPTLSQAVNAALASRGVV